MKEFSIIIYKQLSFVSSYNGLVLRSLADGRSGYRSVHSTWVGRPLNSKVLGGWVDVARLKFRQLHGLSRRVYAITHNKLIVASLVQDIFCPAFYAFKCPVSMKTRPTFFTKSSGNISLGVTLPNIHFKNIFRHSPLLGRCTFCYKASLNKQNKLWNCESS